MRINIHGLINVIFVYFYVFFSFFGDKIGGILPLPLLVNCILILLLIKNKIRVSQILSLSFKIWIILLIYSLIISIINFNIDINYYLRIVRAMISFVGITMLYDSKIVNYKQIIKIIINVLLIHAIVTIISSTLYTDLQILLSSFTGYSRHVLKWRSTGLTTGNDMAGVLSCIGIMLCLREEKFPVLKFFIFATSVLFTSRFSIILFALYLFLYLVFMKGQNKTKDLMCISLLLFSLLVGIILLGITTDIGSNLAMMLGNKVPRIRQFLYTFSNAYANTQLNNVLGSHLNIGDDVAEIIFGKAIYSGADPGYTLFVYACGLIGTFITIMWHLKFLNCIYFKRKDSFRAYSMFTCMCFLVILLGLNFKNCYFFTSTFFELFILIAMFDNIRMNIDINTD